MSDETHARQLVVFTLGAEQYALPIEQVHEIIRYDEPRSVASPIAWVRGVISLRGRIVPVYDLASRLGLDSEISETTKIVIVESGDETAGVIVDEVEEVLTVEEADFERGSRSRLRGDRGDRQAGRSSRRAAPSRAPSSWVLTSSPRRAAAWPFRYGPGLMSIQTPRPA